MRGVGREAVANCDSSVNFVFYPASLAFIDNEDARRQHNKALRESSKADSDVTFFILVNLIL